MTLRSVIYGSNLLVFGVNNQLLWQRSVELATGNPGIGGLNIPSGAGFTGVSLGHHDVVGPGQVPATSVVSSVFPDLGIAALAGRAGRSTVSGSGSMTW